MRKIFFSIFVYTFVPLLFIPILFSLVYGNSVIADSNLVAWWQFNQTSGDAIDSSGNGYSLSNSNVTYGTGRIGNAAYFNGTDAYFSGTGPDLANSSFSVSTWIYANNLDRDQVWLNIGLNSNHDEAMHLRLTTTGALRFGFYDDDLDTPDNTVSTGAWYQVIYMFDASNQARSIYVNGTEVASDIAAGNFIGTNDLTLGSWQGAELWNGRIDDVQIYNRTLTPSEIATLASGGGPVPTPTPGSNSTSGSFSQPSGPSCSDAAPNSAPNLFQVDAAGTYVNLYFTTVKGSGGYNVNYGLNNQANQYGDAFNVSGNPWIMGRTISGLQPNTTYYFKVQGINGCNAGEWSQVAPVKTKNKTAGIIDWFANLASH